MGKSGVLLLCCVMFLHTAHLAESIQITSSPERITYDRGLPYFNTDQFTLTCHIGSVTDEIKWLFNRTTYFSCHQPYSAGICFINTTVPFDYYFTYDVNSTAGISTLSGSPYRNRHEGLWTCSHGGQQATFNVNPGDEAIISTFTTSPTSVVSEGTSIQLTCSLSTTTTLPVDMSISSNGRDGNLTYVTHSTSRTFTVTITAQCEDSRFTCRAFNGYSSVDTSTMLLNVKCPTKIIFSKTNTTVEASIGSTTRLVVYVAGYPLPSFTWYKRVSDQSEVKLTRYRATWGSGQNHGYHVYLYIINVQKQDGGKYSVRINDTGIVNITMTVLADEDEDEATDLNNQRTDTIQITSSPERITYSRTFTLTCHIGSFTDEIQWVFNRTTYFSCHQPYSAGICFKNASASYNVFTYDLNITAGISTLYGRTYRNRHEGLWTCSHGGQQATFNLNPGERASISSFTRNTTYKVSEGTTVQFTCIVTTATTLPVDVSISSDSRDGNLTYVTNSTSRTFTVTTTAQCEDYSFTCRAFNGYGPVSTRTVSLNVKCPVQSVYAKTNTTVAATVGSTIQLKLYYTGYPYPSFTWYRQIPQQSVVPLIRYRTFWSYNVGTSGRYIYLNIDNVHIQDGGQYLVHINGSQIIHVFTVNVQSTQVETNDSSTTKPAEPNDSSPTKPTEPNDSSTTKPTDLDSHVFSPVAGIGIGIAVGVVACIIIVVVIFVIRRLRTKQPGNSTSDPSPAIVSPEPQSHELNVTGYDSLVLQNKETEEELYEELDKDLPNTRT